MKKIVVYPGSFDPPTNGHVDLVLRASKIFNKVVVLIITNISKKTTFSVDERVDMWKKIIAKKKLRNVVVDVFEGLLVEYLKQNNFSIVLRGLRAVSDFEYEFQMVLTNRKMYNEIETIYLMPDIKWTYLSSSLVKEIASFGGDISLFVPREIISLIKKKFDRQNIWK